MSGGKTASLIPVCGPSKVAIRNRGFTLVELILVMAVLSVIFGLSAPRLAGFMKGREVDEECRRLLALSRYARSEAIGQGRRMELWLAPKKGEYGLRYEPTGELENKKLTFRLADGLGLSLIEDELTEENEAVILFWPDGSIDLDSPAEFKLTENEEARYVISLSGNRLEYLAKDAFDEPTS